MSLKDKRVLITGAGGFIGSHLTERVVSSGATSRAFVHYNANTSWGWLDQSPVKDHVEVVSGDIADFDSVRAAMEGVDVVLHLAALIGIPYSYRAPISYVRTNIEGTLNVLRAAQELGTERVVITSTSEVYGTAQYVPIDEGHPLQAQSPYAATKAGADKLAESFFLSFQTPVVTLRPFNTFGPRQSARAIIPSVVAQCLQGDVIRIGNATPTRDFLFVRDTADGFVAAAEAPGIEGQVINLGTGREITIGDLAKMIVEMVGKNVPIEEDAERLRPEGSEVERLCADPSRARDLLGWEPRHTLEEGVALTVDWIGANFSRYRTGDYVV